LKLLRCVKRAPFSSAFAVDCGVWRFYREEGEKGDSSKIIEDFSKPFHLWRS
jgi:hypothetical protein